MWSSPGSQPRRGTVRGTRKPRQGPPPEPRPAVKRLGKIRGAILDVLDAAGGTATLAELCGTLHRKRPRDLRRRLLPMLEEAGIVSVNGDRVSLAADWLDRLEEARELGGEIEAEYLARVRMREKSEAFRNRHKARVDPAPTEEEMDRRREAREEDHHDAGELVSLSPSPRPWTPTSGALPTTPPRPRVGSPAPFGPTSCTPASRRRRRRGRPSPSWAGTPTAES